MDSGKKNPVEVEMLLSSIDTHNNSCELAVDEDADPVRCSLKMVEFIRKQGAYVTAQMPEHYAIARGFI